MQISLSKFLGVVTGIVGILLFLGFGYFTYDLFFKGNEVDAIPTIATINIGILGPKMQKAASPLVNASDKIALKKQDLMFTETKLFKSFVDDPGSIPLSESRGRADPFVPYVAP